MPAVTKSQQQSAKTAVDKIKADESSTDNDVTAAATITATARPAASASSATSGTPRRKSMLPTSATKKRAPSVPAAIAAAEDDGTVEMQVRNRLSQNDKCSMIVYSDMSSALNIYTLQSRSLHSLDSY